ncbi:carbohydrate kinase family protein [Streptomyces sp. NPDC001194]|uniref:carbohydrate kinase family protein n=1 Tax=Streptomyces sp. NPDC001194 TaxID=3364547 RepID=UPI0036C77838
MCPGDIPRRTAEDQCGGPSSQAARPPELADQAVTKFLSREADCPSVFVVGGVAVDVIAAVSRSITSGGFTQATSTTQRIGGCAVNIACGLSDTDVPCVVVGCLGTDERAAWLLAELADRGLATHLRAVPGPTALSMILVDPYGERTIVGLTDDLIRHIDVTDIALRPEDVMVFPQWRPGLANSLRQARAAGCRTVVGLRALEDLNRPEADLAIGSRSEIADPALVVLQQHRFKAIVVTDGGDGSRAYLRDGSSLIQSAVPARPVDATGAGDAYLAGLLHEWVNNAPLQRCMEVGAAWGALATESRTSSPPPWSQVIERLGERP